MKINEYYPYGLQTANSWTRENATQNNFLYNGGTELNTTTSVYDLHFRGYDPILGRMNQVDPLASRYAGATPYNYAFNSPTNLNDPLGDDPNGNCSWCNPKPRPIDTGTAGGGGGGYGGAFAGLMGRSAGFFNPGWQPGSGSLSAGTFASIDARYNGYQIARGNANGLREGTYTNDGNGGFIYSPISSSFMPSLANLSQTDKNRIANAATYSRVSYINGTLNITTIAISETGAGEETDYSYQLATASGSYQDGLKILSAQLWTAEGGLFTMDAYGQYRLAVNDALRSNSTLRTGYYWNRGLLQSSDKFWRTVRIGASALGKVTFVTGAAVSIYGAIRNPTTENWAWAGADITVGLIGLGSGTIATWAGTVGLAIPGLNVIIAGGALAYAGYRLYQAYNDGK